MITTSRVNFRYGTQEGYLRSNIDQNTVYFLTDVGKIFKGTKDVTTNIVPVGESFPPVSEAISDKFYIHVNTLEVRIKAGLSWKVLSPGYISDDCDWADLSSDDNTRRNREDVSRSGKHCKNFFQCRDSKIA